MKNYDFQLLETKESLDEAVHTAGGVGLPVGVLATMTVIELLKVLAPNNIRFVYRGDTPE